MRRVFPCLSKFFLALAACSVLAGQAVPRLPDHKPDLNGVWERPYVPDMTRSFRNQEGMAELPFTPIGEQNWKAYDASKGDYTGKCLPQGLTRSMNSPFPIQIIQTTTTFGVMYEAWNVFHIV